MKSKTFILVYLILLFFSLKIYAISPSKTPCFTENKGQLNFKTTFNDSKIDFYLKSKGMNLYFTKSGIIYQLTRTTSTNKNAIGPANKPLFPDTSQKFSVFTFEMKFNNSDSSAQWLAENALSSYSNFYLPTCRDGLTNVKSYSKITLRNLYPLIDWEIILGKEGIKYNLIVHPGGNPSDILLAYNFADQLSISNSSLLIKTQLGNITEQAPICYQSNHKIINCAFVKNENKIHYQLNSYDTHSDLIIDPGVVWSTYFGGSENEYASCVKTDHDGNVGICGYTLSPNGIFHGGFQQFNSGGSDTFLAKFDTSGNLIWSTYFGGANADQVFTFDFDLDLNLYLSFFTNSDIGIAYNGFQNSFVPDFNAFLVKFNGQGYRIWATYYGSGEEGPTRGGVVTDHQNNVYLYGGTLSAGLSTLGSFQNYLSGNRDGFLAKFDSSGNRLWCTYFGGSEGEEINGACVDRDDNIFISGSTNSQGLGYQGFKDSLSGPDDNFLAKFNSLGQQLWSTYYGGTLNEGEAYCINDSNLDVYLVGSTLSADQISFHGFQNNYQGRSGLADGYIAKFDSTGNRIWATYLGGPDYDLVTGCSLSKTNHILICGSTDSDSGIAYLPYKNYEELRDAFITELDENGSRVWSSYFGGPNTDQANACATDVQGNIYLTGFSGSLSGIAFNGYQPTAGGQGDAFLTQFNCSSSGLSPIISGNQLPDIFGNYIYSVDTTGISYDFWEITGGTILSGQGTDSILVHWDSVGTGSVNVHSMYSPGCYVSSSLSTLINSILPLNVTSLEIYPNPFNEKINFKGENLKSVIVTDVLGRRKYFTVQNNSIDTRLLPNGIYILTGINMEGRIVGQTFRMIKYAANN